MPPENPKRSHAHYAPLHGWGLYPVVHGRELRSPSLHEITERAALSRGLGRSYGDASLPAPNRGDEVACTVEANRILEFDATRGLLRAEAGLSLSTLVDRFLPQGWFTPVSPGTQHVTIGGMIAADIHGKNHHVAGCFGEHVHSLTLRTADGEVRAISEREEPELFRATIGGMGLTGHILEATLQMEPAPSPWLRVENECYDDIAAMIEGLRQAGKSWPFTVAWADTLWPRPGRGVLMKGRWAEPFEAPTRPPAAKPALPVPCHAPPWLLTPTAMRGYNAIRWAGFRAGKPQGLSAAGPFFYPLDGIGHWNRLYGRRGFTQYQCVLPYDGSFQRYRDLFAILERHDHPAFLCVIKDCGPEGKGMLSFPKPGISFALDFPVRLRDTQAVVDELNELVIAEGGRIYLAKDAFTRPEHFAAMEPRLAQWTEVRRRWDPKGVLRSAQSVRLFGD